MFYLSDLTNSISFLHRLSYMRDANNLYIIKIILRMNSNLFR